MKTSKGMTLESTFLILAIIGGFVVFYVSTLEAKVVIPNYIGQYQFSILKAANEAEKALLFIEQSAKYSSWQSLYNLANKGGYIEPDCGFYLGVNLWLNKENNIIKKCYPNEGDNFIQIFNEELIKYLEIYPDALIPANYDYKLSGSLEIIGIAKENLVIDIVPEKFIVKPAITSKNPNEIYQQSQLQKPEILREPAKPGIDIETIKKYHPEVLVQYAELCRRIGVEPPGVCTSPRKKCCITDGYRHSARNQKEEGARNSAHQYGLALDIHIGSLEEQYKVALANEGDDKLPKLFTRVGVYPYDAHIHVDLMPLQGTYAVPFFVAKGGETLATASNIPELKNKASKFT